MTQINDIYILGSSISNGSFGTVYVVINQYTGIKYAMKTVQMQNLTSTDFITEISALSLLKGAPNVVNLVDIVPELAPDIYHPSFVLPLFESDAHTSYPKDAQQLKSAMFDICNGLLALYNRGLYHLDLKPWNILYRMVPNTLYGEYVLTDFGISLKVHTTRSISYNCQIQTLWYRAPEVILATLCSEPCVYNYTADIWSLALIMGEFAARIINPSAQNPIIQPMIAFNMENSVDLLELYYEFLGKPKDNVVCDALQDINLPEIPNIDPRSTFSFMSDIEYDFMISMLQINPKYRPTYEQIFKHSYFNGYMPREPTNVSAINRVKVNDARHIDKLRFDTGITHHMRYDIVTWLIDMNTGFLELDIYFLAIILLDWCLTNINGIQESNLQLYAISCYIVASTTNTSYDPIDFDDAKHLTGNLYETQLIQDTVYDILLSVQYALGYSTESDYLYAKLDDMKLPDSEYETIYNMCNNQLIQASKSPHFRDWPKEHIVTLILEYCLGHTLDDVLYDKLRLLGII